MSVIIYSIGEHVLTTLDYIYDNTGTPLFSLLILDGSIFDEVKYPQLYSLLGTNMLDSRASGDVRVVYKIVADLQQEGV